MTNILNTLRSVRERYSPILSRFFGGKLYAAAVALLVVIGHSTKLEFYFNFPIMISAYLALLFCDSIRAFLPTLLTLVYQINYTHGFSDYYFTPPVFVILIVMVSVLALCFIFYFVRNIAPKISTRSPMLLPLLLLGVGLLCNGLFSGVWVIKNLFYAVLQIFAYILLFYTFYYGLSDEDSGEMIEHLTFLAAMVSLVISGELAVLYLTKDALFADGGIVKEEVHLGWGMWNPIGFSLTVLIPLLMRGAMVGKHKNLYLIGAFITWGFAVLSMSRNALLFSTLFMAACVIIGCFAGERRTLFRILLGIGITAAVGVVVLFYDKLMPLVEKFFDDNGRYDLWRTAIENFLASPIFGKGFYGFGQGNVFAAFLPWLAHNTVLEYLSATGIIGTAAYIYYRASTFVPVFRRISYNKLMLLLPILVTLFMSFIDNYAFHIYTTFIYSLCLALIFKLYRDEQKESETDTI